MPPASALSTLQKRKAAFLEEYSKTGNVAHSCRIASVDRKSIYNWKEKDPEFLALFSEAHECALDALEFEARRRAVEGVLEPVFYKGEECGHIRRFSDTLLIFLMKGENPGKYRDNIAVSGSDGGPVEVVQRYEKAE